MNLLLKVEHISYIMGNCALPDITICTCLRANVYISGKALAPLVYVMVIPWLRGKYTPSALGPAEG